MQGVFDRFDQPVDMFTDHHAERFVPLIAITTCRYQLVTIWSVTIFWCTMDHPIRNRGIGWDVPPYPSAREPTVVYHMLCGMQHLVGCSFVPIRITIPIRQQKQDAILCVETHIAADWDDSDPFWSSRWIGTAATIGKLVSWSERITAISGGGDELRNSFPVVPA